MTAMNQTRWPRILILVACVSACEGRSRAGPDDASSDRSAPQATIPPSPEELGRPPEDWLSWTVADTGFGPITIGMTPGQANDAVQGSLRLPQDMALDGCDYASLEGIDGLVLMIEQGRIVRIDVRRPGIRSTEGAGIGDDEARIHRLYPGRVRVSPHKYTDGHYLTVWPSDTVGHPYRLIFETDGTVVETFRGGMLPQVGYVEGCS